MKKYFLALSLLLTALMRGEEALMIESPPHFEKLLRKIKIKTLLELGVDKFTPYFLESCNKVISVEFITHGYGPENLQHYLKHCGEYSNWIPIAYFTGFPGNTTWAPYRYQGSEHVYNAGSYQCATHQNYALIDDFYLKELDHFITSLFKCHRIDAVYVDSAIYLQGDFVQLLFDKASVILAYRTNCRANDENNDVYGYSRIVKPPHYEEIFLPGGAGTTLWIKKTEKLKTSIEEIKAYAQRL